MCSFSSSYCFCSDGIGLSYTSEIRSSNAGFATFSARLRAAKISSRIVSLSFASCASSNQPCFNNHLRKRSIGQPLCFASSSFVR